jgi:nucleotide-binding universal stress UspA family protein
MKVLLPIDGSNDADLILDFVSKYHWPDTVKFKVVNVVGPCETKSLAQQAEERAKQVVERVAHRVRMLVCQAPVQTEVRFGSAIYEILDSASSWRPNMIIMGYRTRPAIERCLMGSVATGVALQAPCSVTIIRPKVIESAESKEKALANR